MSKKCCRETIDLVNKMVHDMTWMIIRVEEGGDRYLAHQKFKINYCCAVCKKKVS